MPKAQNLISIRLKQKLAELYKLYSEGTEFTEDYKSGILDGISSAMNTCSAMSYSEASEKNRPRERLGKNKINGQIFFTELNKLINDMDNVRYQNNPQLIKNKIDCSLNTLITMRNRLNDTEF